MPHDTMFSAFSQGQSSLENEAPPSRERRSLLSRMKQAGSALVGTARRTGAKGILTAMMAAGAALTGAQHADAQSVVATVTGTLTGGTDYDGVFGFAPGTNMTGQAVTIKFTFDTTQGTSSFNIPGGYNYITSSPGNPGTGTLTINGHTTTFATLPVGNYASSIYQWAPPSYPTELQYSVSDGTYGSDSNTVYVDAIATNPNLLSGGSWETQVYSASLSTSSSGYFSNYDADYYGSADGTFTPTTISIYGLQATNPDAKSMGNCDSCQKVDIEPNRADKVVENIVIPSGRISGADPIALGTGNVFERVVDYSTVGQNALRLIRYYNSMGNEGGINTYATTLGTNWRTNFDRYLQVASTTVAAERPDGQILSFTLSGSTWVSDSDIDVKLTQSGSTWTLTDHNDTVEVYSVSGAKGTLQSITNRNGYAQSLTYSGGLLSTVTDSYSRTLGFTYSGGFLSSVTTPDTLVLDYDVTPVTSGGNVLTSVSYNTSPVTSQTYSYSNNAYPFALTGITDENGNAYAAWTYDNAGRGTSSQLGGVANLTSVAYNTNGTVTLTNPFGVADTYTFSTLQNAPKVTQISRASTSTTAAATETFGYDTNGYLNSFTDWNGDQTTYSNNSHGQPTTVNEAVGSSVARSTTISYDTTWVHMPHQVVTSGLTSTYAYDTHGNPLSRTDVDTTTNSVPYSTNGQSRATQWTWSATGQETSIQLPRTDVTAKTTFGYTGGTLTSITDALSHATNITSYTSGGLPKTIVDPNSVSTTLVYDARLNLNTSTLHTGAGNLVTTYTHDAANELTAVQLPDNSKLTYGYDNAHRLDKVTDLAGNTINYTLDAMGGATSIQIKNSSSTVTASHTATFDALDRKLTDVGVGGTTSYTWDKDSNLLTVAAPSPSGTITNTWDALNRIATRVDPSPGGTTTYSWDAHDKPLTVKDANGNTTSYVNDGFSERTQTVSPDSGTTVYYYDKDRNLSQMTLAGSLTANLTYDAADRNLTVSYPSDSTLNVSKTYDQTGHGDGIGRLTSVTDQPGSDSLTYDERGNVTAESRVVTSVGTLSTSTSYDNASRIASITYPSGTLVSYTRNTLGQVTSITAKPPGAPSASNIATSVAYEPFGPETGLTFGNGMTGAYGYDTDYRATSRADKNGSTSILNHTYAYYGNDSLHTLTDSVTAANSQTLGYDALDRLNSAVSGTGGYGTWSWSWDKVNNVATQVENGTTTTFTPNTGSNQLQKWVTGSTTENVVHTSAGNINTLKIGSTTEQTLSYSQANRLASETTTSTSASYKYGFDGQRLEKAVSGSYPVIYQYALAAKELLSENDQHSGQVADYIYMDPGHDSRPIGEVNPSTAAIYFVHTDRLGTPDDVTNSSKTVVWSARYNPFGDTATFSGTLTNQSLRLPGQYFDPETGMNHNGFRDYAGTLTRYVESDPIGLAGGMNTYQYVKGNPSKFTDRRGLADDDAPSAAPVIPIPPGDRNIPLPPVLSANGTPQWAFRSWDIVEYKQWGGLVHGWNTSAVCQSSYGTFRNADGPTFQLTPMAINMLTLDGPGISAGSPTGPEDDAATAVNDIADFAEATRRASEQGARNGPDTLTDSQGQALCNNLPPPKCPTP